MSKTKSSVRGKQNKKIVVVKPYTKMMEQKLGGIDDQHQTRIKP